MDKPFGKKEAIKSVFLDFSVKAVLASEVIL